MGRIYAVALAIIVVAGAALVSSGTLPDRSSGDPATANAAIRPATAPQPVMSLSVRARGPQHLDAVVASLAESGFAVTGRNDELVAVQAALPQGMTLAEAVTELRYVRGVLYAEPAYTMSTADVPADPLYSRQQSYYSAIKAPQAWDIETGKSYVTVAVVDSGVDIGHPDLQGRIWVNSREIAGNGVDDDGNGCVDDVNGCAFVSFASTGCSNARNGAIRDDVGHGTFVAGVIAANGNNQGVVGVARGVTIMPVKASDCSGSGNVFDVADAILYAANNGARVINMSLGTFTDSLILRDAVRIVTEEKNAVIVASTGNSGEAGVAYPARYVQSIAVGAASSSDTSKRANFSTYGPEVDVVAVGENIVSTVPAGSCSSFLPCIQGPYATGNGTSFTAPQVSGMAALILSRKPFTLWSDVGTIIRNSAASLPPGDRAGWAGAGMINIYDALKPPYRLGVPGTNKN